MKSEPKAFASLSSGLLARKGAARPAMRPQGFGQGGAGLEDLGWNDMGFEPPRAAVTALRDSEHDAFGDELAEQPLRNPVGGLTPVQSPVHSQQAEIADRLVPSHSAKQHADTAFDDEAEGETEEAATDSFEAETPQPEAQVAVPAPAERKFEARAQAQVPAQVRADDRRAPTPRAAPGSKGRSAFTLRLDPARHLKLRLACAVDGRSAQLLVIDALDAFLAGMPELDAMAAKANRKG